MVEQSRQSFDVVATKVVEPAKVVFAFERKAAILDAGIKRRHPVSCIGDCYSWTKEIGREDHRSVGETKLRVLECLIIRLAFPILITAREVQAETTGYPAVILEVSPALPVFACRYPNYCRGKRVEI